MKLMALAQKHMPIAQENAARKAILMRAQKGMGMPPPSSPFDNGQMPQGTPAANTPAGTASQSQQISNYAPNVPATQPA